MMVNTFLINLLINQKSTSVSFVKILIRNQLQKLGSLYIDLEARKRIYQANVIEKSCYYLVDC